MRHPSTKGLREASLCAVCLLLEWLTETWAKKNGKGGDSEHAKNGDIAAVCVGAAKRHTQLHNLCKYFLSS